jgi:site-specific recombinase XerD
LAKIPAGENIRRGDCWYIKEGGDPFSLQYLLGHEDMTVTRMYVKIADTEAKRTYRSLLDGL